MRTKHLLTTFATLSFKKTKALLLQGIFPTLSVTDIMGIQHHLAASLVRIATHCLLWVNLEEIIISILLFI